MALFYEELDKNNPDILPVHLCNDYKKNPT